MSVGGGQQVDEHSDSLTRARQAYAAQDWATAASHFVEACLRKGSSGSSAAARVGTTEPSSWPRMTICEAVSANRGDEQPIAIVSGGNASAIPCCYRPQLCASTSTASFLNLCQLATQLIRVELVTEGVLDGNCLPPLSHGLAEPIGEAQDITQR